MLVHKNARPNAWHFWPWSGPCCRSHPWHVSTSGWRDGSGRGGRSDPPGCWAPPPSSGWIPPLPAAWQAGGGRPARPWSWVSGWGRGSASGAARPPGSPGRRARQSLWGKWCRVFGGWSARGSAPSAWAASCRPSQRRWCPSCICPLSGKVT